MSHRNQRRRSNGRPFSGFARSGMVTAGILLAVLVVFGLYWQAHRKAEFHKLRTREVPPTASVPMPGGLEPITLSRASLLSGTTPEFVSATLLPGVGMQILQATISVPNREQQALLHAPSVADAAALPPHEVEAAPLHVYVSPKPFPSSKATDQFDLVGIAKDKQAETEILPDGGQATANFSNAGGAQSDVSAKVTTSLSGHTIDLVVAATNNGQADRFVALEWIPDFAAPGNDLSRLALTLPSKQVARGAGLPASGGDLDFSEPAGRDLGKQSFDATFLDLRPEFLGDGPVVRIFDLQNGTLLRITAFSTDFRSIHVHTDPVAGSLALGFSSLTPSAAKPEEEERLAPGHTMQWHVRLEVLPAASQEGSYRSAESAASAQN